MGFSSEVQMIPLTPEDRYMVVTALSGGALYLVIGSLKIWRPTLWLDIAFAALPTTRRRAQFIELPKSNTLVIRFLGICFAVIAFMMLNLGYEHHRYITHYANNVR
jgi:multisubunit Na+/H+ antiporter MnhB subunit